VTHECVPFLVSEHGPLSTLTEQGANGGGGGGEAEGARVNVALPEDPESSVNV